MGGGSCLKLLILFNSDTATLYCRLSGSSFSVGSSSPLSLYKRPSVALRLSPHTHIHTPIGQVCSTTGIPHLQRASPSLSRACRGHRQDRQVPGEWHENVLNKHTYKKAVRRSTGAHCRVINFGNSKQPVCPASSPPGSLRWSLPHTAWGGCGRFPTEQLLPTAHTPQRKECQQGATWESEIAAHDLIAAG